MTRAKDVCQFLPLKGCQFGSKVGQILLKCEKSGTYTDKIYRYLICKSPGFVIILTYLTHFGAQPDVSVALVGLSYIEFQFSRELINTINILI